MSHVLQFTMHILQKRFSGMCGMRVMYKSCVFRRSFFVVPESFLNFIHEFVGLYKASNISHSFSTFTKKNHPNEG